MVSHLDVSTMYAYWNSRFRMKILFRRQWPLGIAAADFRTDLDDNWDDGLVDVDAVDSMAGPVVEVVVHLFRLYRVSLFYI